MKWGKEEKTYAEVTESAEDAEEEKSKPRPPVINRYLGGRAVARCAGGGRSKRVG